MTLEHLWAGWRSDYVTSLSDPPEEGAATGPGAAPPDPGPEHCVFCRIAASGPASVDNLVVWRNDLAIAVLNLYPYASGHLLVMPARHVGEMGELTDDEAHALWAGTRRAVTAMGAAFGPEGMNLGANLGRAAGAGIPRHLHFHLVPRWAGDTNFMTTVAGTRVLPQALSESWTRLHRAWPEEPTR